MPVSIGVVSDTLPGPWQMSIAHAVALETCWLDLYRVDDQAITDLDSAAVHRLADDLARHGLQVACLATELMRVPLDDRAIQAEHVAKLPYIAEMAQVLQARLIRCYSPQIAPGRQASVEELLAPLELLAQRAHMEGIALVVENSTITAVTTDKQLLAVQRGCTELGIGLLWDPANGVAGGGDLPDEAMAAKLASWVRHVHVKDVRTQGRLDLCQIGEGILDWPALIAGLTAGGYSDLFALEVYPLDTAPDHRQTVETAATILRTMLNG
jgi:sugar phosphate isomerase/epimerase